MKGKENTQAKCRLTQKTIELSNMGIQASRSHAASKKHLEITHEILCFFQKSQEHLKRKRIAKLNQLLKKVRKSAPKRVLELTLAFSEVVKAEIRWALDSALKRNSNGQNANISTPLKLCF